MRIISGKYKGKKIDEYNIDGTRPTMDRVKESVFGTIQTHLKSSICLDLFAGSGSLGIEALSNGAKKCYFVDSNIKVTNILKRNIKSLNILEDYEIINDDYKTALVYFKNNNIKFDLFFLDPPYKFSYINEALNKIYEYNLLNDNGYIICEYENEIINNNYFDLVKEKKYGNKYVKIYKKNS